MVQVCPAQPDTAALLQKVLDRNQMAAELLAAAIHQEVVLSDPTLDDVAITISIESMAVWIDPIGNVAEKDTVLVVTGHRKYELGLC